jgi:hypothetical protein
LPLHILAVRVAATDTAVNGAAVGASSEPVPVINEPGQENRFGSRLYPHKFYPHKFPGHVADNCCKVAGLFGQLPGQISNEILGKLSLLISQSTFLGLTIVLSFLRMKNNCNKHS